MLYIELGLKNEDYLTEKEIRLFGNYRRIVWNFKKHIGIIVKKKIDNKFVYVIPVVNKLFLKKINKLLKVTGQKSVCISDELFYKEEFINLLKNKKISICDGSWSKKYMLPNILNYISVYYEHNFEGDEIAFLVNSDYEIVLEYLKLMAKKFRIVTIITNNIRRFSKIEKKYLNDYGIELNIVNNYKKSLNKVNIIVNVDFEEEEIKKYNIYNKAIFVNIGNKYEIENKRFEGININNIQIAMPDKYLVYSELFYNFNYMNVYESFIKKRTCISNILKEIKKDNLQIICLENTKGIIKPEDFCTDMKKILDK